ncbi:anti-sigma factor RsbA family regulatory protein [Micromonospora yangpuensis]|uniref:Histidine kinase-like ATPase domain-containing protein n=1 Tax=Micromonospora yangpuensis TaxID=683228 RepID=A0A1C6UQ01_9ACTN|nr:anti-sigma factor RsbA family regulatory protein [Micromonospora yangpuensis]GGM08041.1 anti-sigma regulatory factor [Micromonospora yangpuensis]SCL56092.1 Histidine kinase-like ATPase domain-containing protein [Micromonospora yangpuensis]
MRTGAAAGHQGYYHEAVRYAGDEDLLAVVVPFLLGGVAAGEPTMVALGKRTAALVRAELPADCAVTYLPGGRMYARPTAAIRSYQRLFGSFVAEGARQIRVVGEVPTVALGPTWDWWARYESAINHAYDEFPLWSMCAYDLRTTPPAVLDDVARTHPRVATADGRHVPSPGYQDPVTYLGQPRPVLADPVQQSTPVAELTDPTPVQARAAVYAADDGRLPVDDVEDLVVAVSEAVTNALRHGQPPVRFRLWRAPDRMVVTVADAGDGPKDPFVGLLPAGGDAPGGLGLWITYQSCNHVTMQRGPGGFTLRLTAGNPHVAR